MSCNDNYDNYDIESKQQIPTRNDQIQEIQAKIKLLQQKLNTLKEMMEKNPSIFKEFNRSQQSQQ